MMSFVFNDPAYLALEAIRLQGEAARFPATGLGTGLISRVIPGTALRDLVSVYGYPDMVLDGPRPAPAMPADRAVGLWAAAARQVGHVAAYVRLGLTQDILEPQDADLVTKVPVGEVVAVDLSKPATEIIAGYRKQLRNELGRGHGFDIARSKDVAGFHAIYSQNMQRVSARPEYFFDKAYLSQLCALPGAELWIAADAEGPVAGGIFLRHGDMVYYHLGATADRALAQSPLKQVLHHRITGLAQSGPRLLILGGGLGGGEDALLRFKRGFSKLMLPVYALRIILDPVAYAALSEKPIAPPPVSGFFPAYRAPK